MPRTELDATATVPRQVRAARASLWLAVAVSRWSWPGRDGKAISAEAEAVARAAAGPVDPDFSTMSWPLSDLGDLTQREDGRVAWLEWWRRHGDEPPRRHGGAATDAPRRRDSPWREVKALAHADQVWWWPHDEFVIACEPPVAAHLTMNRPHHETGPAIRWGDGTALYFWHGVHVPADLIEGRWDVETIHRHHNSEVRRAAIERMGWLAYIERAGLSLVASTPDPGNPPHHLHLYEDPAGRLGATRILVMTNGSPDRSGDLRRYAETVPATFDDPIAAAAWQYDCSVSLYRNLQRRT